MQTIIDGHLINYEVLGEKNKDVFLILHGWKRNLNDWNDIAQKLSLKYKVVLVDFPGMGNSSLPNTAFDTYDYAQIINQFIKKIGIKNITLMGHSFGGKVSTILAANNDAIKKLILVDASGIDEKSFMIKIKKTITKIIKPVTVLGPEFLRHFIFSKLASDDYKNAGGLKESFKKIVAQNMETEAKIINIPTLIIWGDKDKEVTIYAAKRFRSLIKNSTLRIVWNTGHNPFKEKPNKFMEILEEFV